MTSYCTTSVGTELVMIFTTPHLNPKRPLTAQAGLSSSLITTSAQVPLRFLWVPEVSGRLDGSAKSGLDHLGSCWMPLGPRYVGERNSGVKVEVLPNLAVQLRSTQESKHALVAWMPMLCKAA